jgi:UDP-N-acetylglucosamine diphosphorylase/glucosamine-1-phosphate N-acetyltransferase
VQKEFSITYTGNTGGGGYCEGQGGAMNNITRQFRTIILAAGKGTRMKSDLVKVLHLLCGKPLLGYVVDAAKKAGSEETLVIVGYQADAVKEMFHNQGLIFIEQREQLGTGHAVLQAWERIEDYDGALIILCGDVPLIDPATLHTLFDRHRQTKSAVTLLTTILMNPAGYGRIVKGAGGEVLRIVEERDATEEEKKIKEINTGIYCVESKFLLNALRKINNNNAQKEYYLTDIIAIAGEGAGGADAVIAGDHIEVMGINTQDELDRASLNVEEMKRDKDVGDADR